MKRRALFLFASDQLAGAERVTYSLASAAAKSRAFDEVMCFILSGARTGTLDDLLSLPGTSLLYSEWTRPWQGLFPCVHLLCRQHYDFVFSSHTVLNALTCLLRRVHLLQADRLITRESTMIFERDFGKRTRLIRAMYRVYGVQDLIICQSERMRHSLLTAAGGHLERKCTVLRNPVDVEQIARKASSSPPVCVRNIPKDRRTLVWCGRLIAVKAPERAIYTLRALHDLGHHDAHLVMIGAGPLHQEVETLAQELRLDQHVTFVGFDPNPPAIMARCEVGLVTSDIEGFPNVVLEMLATGLRGVVTTDCAGGLSDFVGVHVADTSTPQRLASILGNLLSGTIGRAQNPAAQLATPDTYLQALRAT